MYEDLKICEYISKCFFDVFVFKVEIECVVNCVNIMIYIVKSGMVIGKGGFEVELFCKVFNSFIGKCVYINIFEIKRVDFDV